MPKERVKHGEIWVYYDNKDAETSGVPLRKSERIYDKAAIPPDVESVREGPSLDVVWSRETEHVQVSIDFPVETWAACVKDIDSSPGLTHMAIYTDNMSRHEINQMIRTLRRARDAAFGADE